MGVDLGAAIVRDRRPFLSRVLSRSGLLLVGLVVLSAVGRILLGREISTPWISPDEMIYGLLGRTLYQSGRLAIEGAHSDFYSLVYPGLIGGPLAWLSPERGYEAAKAIGAVCMSLAALPAYLWARMVVSRRAALVVAALTLALPAFSYSGLLMTETLFYPLLVLVGWTATRTLVEPSVRRQLLLVALVAVAVLTRLQAVVLVLVFPTAVFFFSGAALRQAPRRFAVVFSGFGLGVVAWLGWRLAHGGGLLGAYTAVASGGYQPGIVARFVLYHLGDLVLLTGFFPICAVALLWFERRRLLPEARATLAVTTALSVWLVLQVGVFASRYVGHLAERDLIAAAPPAFLCLAIWLELGAPRTLRRSLSVTGVALAALLTWPAHTLLVPGALPDAPSLIPVFRLAGAAPGHQQLLLDGVVLLAGLLLVVLPRRALLAVPFLLVALLGAGSVIAEQFVANQAGQQQKTMLGPQRDWIDRSADGPVSFLYGGKLEWPAVWESLFWNRKLEQGFVLPGGTVIGPAPGGRAELAADGTVLVSGRPTTARLVVARIGLLVTGTPVTDAGISPDGTLAPWRLWRLDTPLQVLGRSSGFQQNGDIYNTATVRAYRCPATLRLTLLVKEDQRISFYLQGRLYRSLHASPGSQPFQVLHLRIPSKPGVHGPCSFQIKTTGLLGSTVVALDPP